MKHKFTFLMAAVMLLAFLAQPIGMMGQTKDEVVAYTLDGTQTGGTNGYATESEITQNNITWKVTGNTDINPWRIGGKSLSGVDRPVYSTTTMSDNITKIVVTHGTAASITVNSMTLIVSSNADFSNPTSTMTGTFAASATTTFERPTGADWSNKYFKIVYNVTVSVNSNKFLQFVKAEFYKESGGSSQTVATPTFSPAGGTYSDTQTVTISCATSGATIYYTTDGNDPEPSPAGYTGTVYSSPISVSTTTTIKAIATKDNMSASAIATAVYTIQQLPTITSIDSLWTFAASVGSTQPNQVNANVTFNNWYVTGIRNNQVCVSDGQYGFVIFQSGHGFTAGDKLSGTVACKVLLYQNHYAEITGVKATDLTVTPNQEIPVLQTTIGALETRNYGTAIDLGTLVYDGTTFNDVTGAPITPYNNFNLDPNPISSLEANKEYHVKGVSIIYWTSAGQTQQIAPRDANDFELIDNPTFYAINIDPNIANGTVTADTLWATEGTPVVLTVIPDDNYQLETLTYSYTGTAPIDISDSHQFTMPACDVDVTATFSPIQMETVATPTFDPAEGTYTSAQTVAILCETQGATIYYTLDGNDPITPTGIIGTEFTEAITISETTTVKAIAVRDGMNSSEIATAVYTINAPAQATAYTLITNTNALVVGEKYIIVGIKSDAYKALGKQNNNNRAAVDVTPTNNVITVTPATEAGQDAVYELTLGLDNNNWTLFSAADSGFLYAASSSSNLLKVQQANDANGQWSIEIASNGVATIKAQGTNTRNWIRLNNNGSPFACYASGQLDVYLYKAGDVPAPPQLTYYAINIDPNIANGTVTADTLWATEGTPVTLTATPATNYQLESLTYSYTGTAPIDITQTKQFVMPACDVDVTATFTEVLIPTVATPVITPATGTFYTEQQVTITCATEGATIYYTTDGTDPVTPTGPNGTVYTESFTVNETTIVKAYAVKDGMYSSDIATSEITIILPMTIAQAKALDLNEYALVQGVVTFIDGRNIYIQDSTAGIDLYLNNNTVPSTLALGDMVQAYGKRAAYNGLIELSGINGGVATQFSILSSGNELPVATKTIAEILEDYQSGANLLQSTRVQIEEAIVGEIDNNNNTPITQGDNTLNIYKMPVVDGLLKDDIVTVIGVIGCYNNPQLRVASATDVTFEHPAVPSLVASPNALSGFTYVEGEGPSTIKTFVLTGSHLNGIAYVYPSENFQISTFGGDNFVPEYRISINTTTGNFSFNIYVRMKEGLSIGSYSENLTLYSADTDSTYVAVSGTVTEQAQSSEYTRISDLTQLSNGSKVIFAARFDDNAGDYYAMTAQASGKPTGVLFTSVAGTNSETLPSTIADEDDTYYWTVTVDGTNYTFTNADGDVLGYNSSTNFATGGDNINWNIEAATSAATAMVPEYSAFVITNANSTNRAFALNSNHNFGPYHTQNIASDSYNFFIDMFATTGSGPAPLVCATPTFTPAAGTYFESQSVTISTTTADASIYYTLDGTDPNYSTTPIVGTLYDGPITVSENTIIKAIAVKEGYDDSAIATAEYTIIMGAVTIFNQDWEGDMNGWTFVNVEGNKPWSVASHNNNHYAYANGYNDDTDNEQWCISPAFNLNNYNDVTLTFLNAKNYTGPDLQLFFSNDYDGEDPTAANWTELSFEMSTGSYAWTESGAIQFFGFAGTNCHIGFCYTSTVEGGAAAWEVDDILLVGFTSAPTVTTTASSLTGFSYVEGNGPSTELSFTVNGMNLTDDITVTIYGDAFEMSTESGEDFDPMSEFDIEINDGAAEQVVYVRLAEGLEVGDYEGTITIESEIDDITVTLSGTVIEPAQGGDWSRILSLSDLNDGDMVILASRYDATVGDGYYAMPAVVSGKPDGVLFTSVNENGTETLPAEIAAEAETYYWNVLRDGDVIQLINVSGDTIGYSSSTNFAGNVNTAWNIAYETSGENAMIPNYSGFVITNGTTTNRGIAKNASNKFGAYSTSNINNADYNFYLDLFVQGGTSTPTVAAPVFSVASGTYYEEFEVEITCATDGATIYYTTDGTEPTANSEVYEEPILVDQDMTIKAIAMMEGYENSTVTTVNYVIITDVQVIFSQDWEGEMDGWTFVTVEGNKPWTINTYAGNKFANANGYNDDSDNEQWCISPAFDLDQYTRDVDVTLTFMNATKFNGPALELYFSDDYDGEDPTTATWVPLDYIQSEGNYEWVESGPISLNGFRGDNCYIGFRYISTLDEGAASWEIDDIVLTAKVVTSIEEELSWNVNVWNRDHEILVENEGNAMYMVVYNLLGQPVLNTIVNNGSSCVYHNLNGGMYIVTLQNNKGRVSTKIVVR